MKEARTAEALTRAQRGVAGDGGMCFACREGLGGDRR
jgi:hypothetical protein